MVSIVGRLIKNRIKKIEIFKFKNIHDDLNIIFWNGNLVFFLFYLNKFFYTVEF